MLGAGSVIAERYRLERLLGQSEEGASSSEAPAQGIVIDAFSRAGEGALASEVDSRESEVLDDHGVIRGVGMASVREARCGERPRHRARLTARRPLRPHR